MKHGLWVAPLALLAAQVPAHADVGLGERRAALEAAAQLLESRYVYPERGKALARDLRREIGAAWVRTANDVEFADALTRKLRAASGDGHFKVDFREPGEAATGEAQFGAAEFEKFYGKAVNHGFEQVRRFEDNIGYLDLRVFAPPAMAADMASAAMTLLAETRALIVDLRRNGGGDGEMALFLAAYLLDHPTQMSGVYDRPSDTLTPASTPVWVPGRRFGADKPVYVLISRQTFSAAEAFAYDLQALKRVTVIGEPSGGGAHPFVYRKISEHFVLSLPEARSVNPVTGKDWEGVGVIPDVRVAADQALDEALKLARAR
ncbi:MAG TPA: S41 family peptidase [Steroidobacteraceae bacterium]|nr:S41 family peptidase [Steroidobacteraceae bacterium]